MVGESEKNEGDIEFSVLGLLKCSAREKEAGHVGFVKERARRPTFSLDAGVRLLALQKLRKHFGDLKNKLN